MFFWQKDIVILVLKFCFWLVNFFKLKIQFDRLNLINDPTKINDNLKLLDFFTNGNQFFKQVIYLNIKIGIKVQIGKSSQSNMKTLQIK